MPSAISEEKLTVHLALVINLNISFPSETNAAMELSRVLCAKRPMSEALLFARWAHLGASSRSKS